MKNIYTWAAHPATRNLTVADMQAQKGQKQWVEVTANTEDEAAAAEAAGVDLLICHAASVEEVRAGSKNLFLTASLVLQAFVTEEDILRGAFEALTKGADAVMTPRSMKVVKMLASEDVPVRGHLGLVPRKSTWVGGLRAIGKSAGEAYSLYRKFKGLEEAGAVMVESEVIPGPVMAEITRRTSLITVSLGSGDGADVNFLFMSDICGEQPDAPRHAKAYANLHELYEKIKSERVRALTEFCADARSGRFPGHAESVSIDEREMEGFLNLLEKEG